MKQNLKFLKKMKLAYFILTVISLLIISGGAYFTFKEYKRSVDNRAIHECAQDYVQIATSEAGLTIKRPMEQQARECAWQKGVKDYEGVWSDLLK